MLISPFIISLGMAGVMLGVATNLDIDEMEYRYDFLNNTSQKTVVIYPAYTYYANEVDSLVDFGTDNCDDEFTDCKSYLIHGQFLTALDSGGVSDVGASIAEIGHQYFFVVNDDLVHRNPEVLDAYDKVILMRNVYVTDELRNTILGFDKVIYMFPDAMTKKIDRQLQHIFDDEIDLDDSDEPRDKKQSSYIYLNMTYSGEYKPLHEKSIEWADDNRCEEWEFVPIHNGYMMNCTPDIAIINNYEMLKAMRDL